MKNEFTLQDPGEGVKEVEILELMVAEGDTISEGQEVMAVESDKAAIELPSPYGGTVAEICVKQGDTVSVGDVLLIVQDDTEDAEGASDGKAAAESEAEATQAEQTETQEAEKDEPARDERKAKPEHGEEPEEQAEEATQKTPESADDGQEETGETGDADREEDDEEEDREEEDREEEDREEEDDEEGGTPSGQPSEDAPVRASPAARKLAQDKGIDLSDLEPSGEDGQVTVDDVRKKASDGGRKATETLQEDREVDDFGPIERETVSAIRAATARAMTRSWAEIPHVTHEDTADITQLELWRRRQAEENRLSLTAIVAKATTALLNKHPRLNATYEADEDQIVLRRYYNISVAIATDRGLVTPVLKKVDRKTAVEIDEELVALGEKAKDQTLRKEDLSGGTFTITNVGAFGGRGLTPLINPPQTAILGLGRARVEPVVLGDIEDDGPPNIEARMMLPLALSFDHRVIDGADAARFVAGLAAVLSEPASLAMEL